MVEVSLTSKKHRDHLYIPDRQVTPDSSNAIDHAIGNYIVKHRPAVIVNGGDHADMGSLSSYDIGTKSAEGKCYQKDIDASINAHEIMFKPLNTLNQKQRKNKEKLYKPVKAITIGNHEQRIIRTTEKTPKLYGKLTMDDLEYDRFYDYVMPFLDKIEIDGVQYVHYAWKKMPSKAMGGELLARNILNHEGSSITVGHTPEFQYYEKFRGDGKKIQCMVAGACFDHYEPYAAQRNKEYWRGIVHKKDVKDGVYDFERVSLDRLLRDYL